MTAIPEPKFRRLASDLCKADAVPVWFEDVEYVPWKNCKDLTLVSDAIENAIIIDDYPGNICTNQKSQWIQIAGFYEEDHNPDDREFERVQHLLAGMITSMS